MEMIEYDHIERVLFIISLQNVPIAQDDASTVYNWLFQSTVANIVGDSQMRWIVVIHGHMGELALRKNIGGIQSSSTLNDRLLGVGGNCLQ